MKIMCEQCGQEKEVRLAEYYPIGEIRQCNECWWELLIGNEEERGTKEQS
jgi:hypothetical protein